MMKILPGISQPAAAHGTLMAVTNSRHRRQGRRRLWPAIAPLACVLLSGAAAPDQFALGQNLNQNLLQPEPAPAPFTLAFSDPALYPLPAVQPGEPAEAAAPAAAELPDAPSALVRAETLAGLGQTESPKPGTEPAASLSGSASLDAAPVTLYLRAQPFSAGTDLQQPLAPMAQEQAGAVNLTLDDAVAAALKTNLQVRLSLQQELGVHGEIFTVGNALLPNLQVVAYSRAQEINLAAQGFSKSLLSTIKIPGVTINAATFNTIVKVNTTSAQLDLSQALFNLPAFYLFRAAFTALDASHWTALDARGGAVEAVGGLYLRALADESQVRDSEARLKQDQVVFDHAKASRDAGVGINLDVLRAQTDLQTEQERLLQAQNAIAKDKIQLNRVMGQSAGQQLNLVDTVPFAELTERTLDEQLAIAFEHRPDLRSLESQLKVAEDTARAIRYERLPTLGVGGYYGVIGVTTGSYHGNFAAQFKLSFPIFQEAELRGQAELGAAEITGIRRQVEARKAQIEADIRSSRLDLQSSDQLVKVARSNVALAQQALDDATLRFTSGVDDNLAVVRAQATLVQAQAQVTQAEFQYNYAKLTLARRLGIVEADYDKYLGK